MLLIAMFSFFVENLFWGHPFFDNYFKTVRLVFSYALGQFDFESILDEYSDSRIIVGVISMSLFVMFSMLLLLNLIVALLSSIYTEFNIKSTQLYYDVLL